MKKIVIIGYSGHSFVAIDVLMSMGNQVTGYCEEEEKKYNPYKLLYLGNESDPGSQLYSYKPDGVFIAIGENDQRKKCYQLIVTKFNLINAIHKTAILSDSIKIGNGNLVSPGVVINSQSIVGNCCILNTHCVVEHESTLGDFVHIAPGAIICGNVQIGSNTLIGAGAIILPNLTIGSDVIIGAGSVVIKDVPSYSKLAGIPARKI